MSRFGRQVDRHINWQVAGWVGGWMVNRCVYRTTGSSFLLQRKVVKMSCRRQKNLKLLRYSDECLVYLGEPCQISSVSSGGGQDSPSSIDMVAIGHDRVKTGVQLFPKRRGVLTKPRA